VDFSLMNQYLVGGVMVIVVFMLVARPVTVFLCALPDRRARWSLNEMLFMCWTRETGVIPGALAGLLLGMNAPGARIIASVTFIAILMTILIQAPTTKWLGRRLGLLEENPGGWGVGWVGGGPGRERENRRIDPTRTPPRCGHGWVTGELTFFPPPHSGAPATPPSRAPALSPPPPP